MIFFLECESRSRMSGSRFRRMQIFIIFIFELFFRPQINVFSGKLNPEIDKRAAQISADMPVEIDTTKHRFASTT